MSSTPRTPIAARHIPAATVNADTAYEPTMEHRFGIDSSCGSTELNMHTAYLEPGAATRAHFHVKSDAGIFILEGEGTWLMRDQNNVTQEIVSRPGDYVFIPRGVIHKVVNRSPHQRFALVAAYNNAGTGEDTLKFYVEDDA
jgi:uncharacterized RmlC-like cupin family protein